MRSFLKRREIYASNLASSLKCTIATFIDFTFLLTLRVIAFGFCWVSWFENHVLEFKDEIAIIAKNNANFVEKDLLAYFFHHQIFTEVIMIFLIFLLLGFCYETFLNFKFNATIGKKLVGIKLLRINGKKLSIFILSIRYVLSLIPILFFIMFIISVSQQDLQKILIYLLLFTVWNETHLFKRDKYSIHDWLLGLRIYKSDVFISSKN